MGGSGGVSMSGAMIFLALQMDFSPAKHSVWDQLVLVTLKPVEPNQPSTSKCLTKPLDSRVYFDSSFIFSYLEAAPLLSTHEILINNPLL